MDESREKREGETIREYLDRLGVPEEPDDLEPGEAIVAFVGEAQEVEEPEPEESGPEAG